MTVTESQRRLLAARLRVINAGDKALGREIYHQLQQTGMQGHEIDAWSPEPDVVETADAEPALERAVRKTTKGDSQ